MKIFAAFLFVATTVAPNTLLAADKIPAVLHFRSAPMFGSVETTATCKNHDGSAGSWAEIDDDTRLEREAYVTQDMGHAPPLVVVCNDIAGGPGVINGIIPKGSVLPPGTRIDYRRPGANIVYMYGPGPNQAAYIGSISLTQGSIIRTSPLGVIAGNTNDLTIYPPGATLSIGDSFGTAFYRPGTPAYHATATGCRVTYVKPNQPEEVLRTHDDCNALIKRAGLDNLFNHRVKP